MMRVLVTGAHGQVGRELTRNVPSGFKVVALGSDDLDITDVSRVNALIANQLPDLIINAAAYTAVDKAESDRSAAYAVNRDGVANLGLVAARRHIPVLHISTDYVFRGDAHQPYSEQDAPDPTGVYGASKLAGEQLLINANPQHIILRTSWVFGAHGNNFVKTMLKLAASRDTLSVVSDQMGGPTPAASIADALWRIAQQYSVSQNIAWGIYHFGGHPPCTWHDFAQTIFQQAFDLGMLAKVPVVNAITTQDYPTPAKRPAWSVLDNSKISTSFGIEAPCWKSGLQRVLEEIRAVG